jgi:hypothetical protein
MVKEVCGEKMRRTHGDMVRILDNIEGVPTDAPVNKERVISSMQDLHQCFLLRNVKISFLEIIGWGRTGVAVCVNCNVSGDVGVAVGGERAVGDSVGGDRRRRMGQFLLREAALAGEVGYWIVSESKGNPVLLTGLKWDGQGYGWGSRWRRERGGENVIHIHDRLC